MFAWPMLLSKVDEECPYLLGVWYGNIINYLYEEVILKTAHIRRISNQDIDITEKFLLSRTEGSVVPLIRLD